MENLEYIIRAFEEEIQRQFKSGILKGTIHLCIGQEHIDVAIIKSFNNPLIFGNHRSHGQYIASTGDLKGLYKQICENRTQHLYYPDKFLSHGVQGALCPVAVGNALAFKLRGINRKVLCFVGDGTLGQGIFWESLNFAVQYSLNISFVIIDNDYSMSKTKNLITAVNLNSVFPIHVELLNDEHKDGCVVIYTSCSRLCGHSCNDTQQYRSKNELLIDYLTDETKKKHAEQIVQDIIGR